MSDGEAQAAVNEQRALDEKPVDQTEGDKEKSQAVQDFAKTENGDPIMDVRVYSPFKSYYDAPTFSISAENETGPFDILPRHHNFISLLTPCELVIRSVKQGEQRIKISGGIMHVKADKVIVFLDV